MNSLAQPILSDELTSVNDSQIDHWHHDVSGSQVANHKLLIHHRADIGG
jgi:hypothetical protein